MKPILANLVENTYKHLTKYSKDWAESGVADEHFKFLSLQGPRRLGYSSATRYLLESRSDVLVILPNKPSIAHSWGYNPLHNRIFKYNYVIKGALDITQITMGYNIIIFDEFDLFKMNCSEHESLFKEAVKSAELIVRFN